MWHTYMKRSFVHWDDGEGMEGEFSEARGAVRPSKSTTRRLLEPRLGMPDKVFDGEENFKK